VPLLNGACIGYLTVHEYNTAQASAYAKTLLLEEIAKLTDLSSKSHNDLRMKRSEMASSPIDFALHPG